MIDTQKTKTVGTAGANMGDITYAIEFLTTALRALADGHSPDSQMVEDPLLWAYSKVNEMAAPVLAKGRREAA